MFREVLLVRHHNCCLSAAERISLHNLTPLSHVCVNGQERDYVQGPPKESQTEFPSSFRAWPQQRTSITGILPRENGLALGCLSTYDISSSSRRAFVGQ